MAIESLWLLIIFIAATQISLVLISTVAAAEYLRLFIIAVELIDYRFHKLGIGFCFHFTKLVTVNSLQFL